MAEKAAYVIVVEDDELVRITISSILASVGLKSLCFGDPDRFLESLPDIASDCILMDVRMPGITGIDLLQRVRALGVGVPVIIMTGYADVDTAVNAFRRGAFDFITKPLSGSSLIETVQRAVAHNLASRRFRELRVATEGKISTLTPREGDVLPLLVAGNSNKQIGRLLGISHRTAERHRQAVLTKMNVGSLVELVRAVEGRPGSVSPARASGA